MNDASQACPDFEWRGLIPSRWLAWRELSHALFRSPIDPAWRLDVDCRINVDQTRLGAQAGSRERAEFAARQERISL